MDKLLSTFKLPTNQGEPDSHTMRAVQTILQHVRNVVDLNGIFIFTSAELVKYYKDSLYKAESPYALLSILPGEEHELTGEGTIVNRRTPMQLALVFAAEDSATEHAVQAMGSSLAEWVMRYLEEYTIDNPQGIDFRYEVNNLQQGIWMWDSAPRKEELDRRVAQADGSTGKLDGSRWRYLLQFTIKTFATTRLP